MIRLLVAALTLVAGTFMPSLPASAQGGEQLADGWHDGPCTDNVGVTIVIDFQDLGGGINVRCAPGPVTSGLDALDQADIAWEGTRRFAGVVCRIAGLPGPDTEACFDTPPGNAYWGYWMASRGGDWCYSTIGAGSRTPPAGSIEGWSFSRGANVPPPPRYEPPPAIEGQASNPIRPGDCAASGSPTTTTTTPAATSTTAAPVVEPPPADTDPPAATTVAPAAPTTARPSTAGITTSTTTIVAAPTTTTPSSTTSTSTTTTPAASTTSGSTSTSTSSTSPPASTSSTSVVPLGTVDLNDDQRGGGGFGAATAAGIVSVAGLAGTGIWIARRRRIAA